MKTKSLTITTVMLLFGCSKTPNVDFAGIFVPVQKQQASVAVPFPINDRILVEDDKQGAMKEYTVFVAERGSILKMTRKSPTKICSDKGLCLEWVNNLLIFNNRQYQRSAP